MLNDQATVIHITNFSYICDNDNNTMNINNQKTYEEIDARIEQLLEKGTELGGVDMLSEKKQEELNVLSEAAYNWEREDL